MNFERTFSVSNFGTNGTIAYNPIVSGRYLPSGDADSFVHSGKQVNPAAQNPIHSISDDYLAKFFPQGLIDKYSNSKFLSQILEANPNIKMSLAQELIPAEIYAKNVSSEIYRHFIPTAKAAFNIMKNSGENFSKKDYETMAKAALLHDVGKAYIPDEILNKKGRLDDYERKIVNKHAQFSYEILRSAGVKGQVLELVKNHHTYGKHNPGMVQILQIADIWSALKEERPYKKVFSNEEAFNILYERADKGEFEIKYVDALRKSQGAAVAA